MSRSIEWARGEVRAAAEAHPGLQRLDCVLEGGRRVAALSYTELLAPRRPGDWVWLNLRALDLELGTGGAAFVVAPADPPPVGVPVDDAVQSSSQPPALLAPRAESGQPKAEPRRTDSGFLVKARYTPLQVAKRGVDSQGSPHHATLARAESLDGLPVVVADLHSSLPAVCAAIVHDAQLADRPKPRLVYVMTDGAALPLALSRTAARLTADGVIDATITAGQAYGGDFEAVSVHSALLAAKHVAGADIALCVQGPGNLGTDTPWGFSGVGVGEAVNAIVTLGGRAVGCLRVSGADWRERHRGLSHHSLTAYGRVALLGADLALPELTGSLAELGWRVAAAAAPLAERHRLVPIEVGDLDPVLAATPGLSTMGRDYAADPAAFLAAAAAGRLAWRLFGRG